MAVTHPDRKPVRPREVVGIYLRNGWNMRQAGHGDFDPRRRDYREDRDTDSDQDGRSNPDTKSAIRRIVDGSVCRIERDHIASANIAVKQIATDMVPSASWRVAVCLHSSAYRNRWSQMSRRLEQRKSHVRREQANSQEFDHGGTGQ